MAGLVHRGGGTAHASISSRRSGALHGRFQGCDALHMVRHRKGVALGDLLAAEGREAFRRAAGELRSLGHLSPDATTASGVGERPVVDPAPAAAARLIPQRDGLGLSADEADLPRRAGRTSVRMVCRNDSGRVPRGPVTHSGPTGAARGAGTE